jgi:hypothetical protein
MAEKAEIVISGKDQTAAAFASALKNLAALRKNADSTLATIAKFSAGGGAIGLVASGLNAALNPAPVIEYADQLNKLSQRTGIAVEDLSALDFQAKLAGISTEELAGNLKKLNQNIAAAARGEKEQAEAFKTIGVAVTDSSGKARNAIDVLGDVAQKFAGFADSANKVALANAIGGKSFEALIPLLNSGRQGIVDARIELDKFGGVISTKLAQESERFNDNLVKIGTAASALKITIASGFVERFAELSDKWVEAAKNGKLLEFAIDGIKKAAKDRLTGQDVRDLLFGVTPPPDRLKEAQAELAATTAQVDKLQAKLASDPGNQVLARQLKLVEENAKAAADEVAALRGAQNASIRGQTDNTEGRRRFNRARPDAPPLPNASAESDAAALLRKQLEGRIKAIQESLAREADLFDAQSTRLADAFADGQLSIATFFDSKARAQEQFLVKQQELFDKEIAALRQFQAKATKPQEREDTENRIAEVLAKQSKAYREAGQAAEAAERQRVRATEEFRRSLADLDAQLAELSGDRFGAELIRNAERLRDAQRLLAQDPGADQGRIAALDSALRVQAEFGKVQEDIARANASASVKEEAFLIRAQRQGLSRAETEAEILRIREGSIAQLDKLIAQAEQLSAETRDPAVIAYLEQLRVARERAFDAKDPGLQRFNELAAEGGKAVADSFADAVLEGEGFLDVLDRLDKQLTRLVFEDLVTKPLAGNITNLIKDLGAGGSGGGAQTLLTGAGNAIGSLFGITPAGGGAAAAGVDAAGAAAQSAAAAATTAALSALSASAGAAAAAETASTTATTARISADTAAAAATAAFTAALSAATGAAATSAATEGAGAFLGVFHGGGVVGGGGRTRAVDQLAFAGAQRYHGGGVIGEVPAILRRGEEVLTESDPRHRNNAGGRTIGDTLNVVVQIQGQPGMSRQTLLQQGRSVGDGIALARSRNG